MILNTINVHDELYILFFWVFCFMFFLNFWFFCFFWIFLFFVVYHCSSVFTLSITFVVCFHLQVEYCSSHLGHSFTTCPGPIFFQSTLWKAELCSCWWKDSGHGTPGCLRGQARTFCPCHPDLFQLGSWICLSI